jgi:hypothetical protein
LFIGELEKAQIDSRREKPYQEIQVEKECRPGRRLMLGYGGNDGNVNFSITSVP